MHHCSVRHLDTSSIVVVGFPEEIDAGRYGARLIYEKLKCYDGIRDSEEDQQIKEIVIVCLLMTMGPRLTLEIRLDAGGGRMPSGLYSEKDVYIHL